MKQLNKLYKYSIYWKKRNFEKYDALVAKIKILLFQKLKSIRNFVCYWVRICGSPIFAHTTAIENALPAIKPNQCNLGQCHMGRMYSGRIF